MSEADQSQMQGKYQASSLVVAPRPNESGFPLREDEFEILCEGSTGDARASRDLAIGILVGTLVGLIGVFATTDWTLVWQPEKRRAFLFWAAILFAGTVAAATAACVYNGRVRRSRTDSAYSRLREKIAQWYRAQQIVVSQLKTLTIISARYGSGSAWMDVGDRLRAKIESNQLRMMVTNDELGGDPAVNLLKTLTVQYEHGGTSNSTSVSEGQELSIPEASAAK